MRKYVIDLDVKRTDELSEVWVSLAVVSVCMGLFMTLYLIQELKICVTFKIIMILITVGVLGVKLWILDMSRDMYHTRQENFLCMISVRWKDWYRYIFKKRNVLEAVCKTEAESYNTIYKYDFVPAVRIYKKSKDIGMLKEFLGELFNIRKRYPEMFYEYNPLTHSHVTFLMEFMKRKDIEDIDKLEILRELSEEDIKRIYNMEGIPESIKAFRSL